MKNLWSTSRLVLILERSIGWCPNPPTANIGSIKKSPETGQKVTIAWWWFILIAITYSLLFSPPSSPLVRYYSSLTVGIVGTVNFGIIGLANIAHSYEKKEEIYYLRTIFSFLMCFARVSIILGNFLLGLVFFFSIIIISSIKYLRNRQYSSGVADTK